jgi:hypothetical protein
MAIIPDFMELFGEYGDISSLLLEAADTLEYRPLVFCALGPQGKLFAKIEQSNRVAVFSSCERGVRALAKLWSYTQRLSNSNIDKKT